MFGAVRKSARLSQWDARSCAGADAVPWPWLWGRAVAGRLAVVVVAAGLLAGMLWLNGPVLAYRIGETYPRDLRVRTHFEVVNKPLTERLREEVQSATVSPSASTSGSPVRPVVERYLAGTPLVKRGEAVTEAQHALLAEEHRAWLHTLTPVDHTRRFAGLFGVTLLLAGVICLYVARYQPTLGDSPGKVANVCLLVLGTVGAALLLSRPPWHAVLVPVVCSALVLTLAYNPPFALLVSFSQAVVLAVGLETDLGPLLVHTAAGSTAVLLLRGVRKRFRLVEVAAAAGMAAVAMTVSSEELTGQTFKLMTYDSLRNLVWCLLAGFVLSGCLPLLERGFGLVTDASLLELADSSHPLLQELIRRAPGTYTHSMTVATLAEAAAEAIGANSLLTRVGCYYHDIGKMLKPGYFIENQTGSNRHDGLEPALSTLVIVGHVKDGLALAEQYHLPAPIKDFIRQHHGTTLVEFFYREALRLQEANGHGSGDLESTFRYPGPRPQSREVGILMLADAVESASRALTAPTPNSLRKLVHDLLMRRLLDGQFDESGLTLTELHRVEESLCKNLVALYHSRVKYPEPRCDESPSGSRRALPPAS